MKRCPECRRDYYDDTLMFCLEDGTALVQGSVPSPDEPQTAVFPGTGSKAGELRFEPPTRVFDSKDVASSETRRGEGFWVAVLPFKVRGVNADLEALAEGLSEEIVTGLSRFSYLRVIARSSTLRFAGDPGDARAIGKELGARYVIEGSLRQAGSQLRVMVQLVDASTGAHVWAETYNCAFSPEAVFEIQDDLVPRIVSTVADWYGALPHSMSEAVRRKSADQLTPDEAVLRGFGYFERIAPDEHAVVRAILERAVKQAPGNADAWALLAMLYGEEHRFGFNPQPDPLGRALQAAHRAVETAPANHFAWLALAQALYFRREFDAFRDAAENVLRLNPMDGAAAEYLGHLFAFGGEWERGCALAEKARALNPNHPGWYWHVHFLDAFRKGEYREALTFISKDGVRRGGANLFRQTQLAAIYGQLGEFETANKVLKEVLSIDPNIADTVRGALEKWYRRELVDQLIDGLRKAGLAVEVPASTRSGEFKAKEPASSIAVLPFANISADEGNEYFCDGLAEELLNALSRIDGLRVAARTSAFSFKGKEVKVNEIAQALNVRTVLEGSVRRSGDRIRISVQLVNAADGYQLWSERYDREMKDIFDVQDEIAVAVVGALKIKLLGADKAALLKHQTQSPEAYEYYLRGLSHFNKWTPADFEKAVENFEKAIGIDPDYASAYAAMADAYTELLFFSFSSGDARQKARNAADKALALDTSLAEAHNSLALIKMYFDWDYPAAEAEFKRAIALNPGSASVRMWYGWFLALMGRFDESLVEMRRGHELDPLSPPNNNAIGVNLHWAGKPERAIAQFLDVLELNPNYTISQSFLAEAYVQAGDLDAAVATIESVHAEAMDPQALAVAGFVYARAGDREKAVGILNEFEQRSTQGNVSALNFAQIYASLGDNEQAFAWLDKALEEQAIWLPFLKVDVKFDPLRPDPRFQALLRRVGF
ncbi:MAG: tetratricopeptide repeat protein [Pyrinomonadaceae bacterium]